MVLVLGGGLTSVLEEMIRKELGEVRKEIQEAYEGLIFDYISLPEKRYLKKMFFKTLKKELKSIKKELQ